MSKELLELAAGDIRAIASAVRSGRLIEPVSALAVGRLVGANSAEEVRGLLTDLYSSGCSPEGVARCLDVLAAAAEQRRRLEESVQIVTTGPEMVSVANRDTMVVVEEMFRRAERNVLISGYAVYEGRKVFRELAGRTQERPNLRIRMFLDIHRKAGDSSLDSEIVWRFVDHFRRADWSDGCPLPEIYYDPRSLASGTEKRAVLHAKCVVVDDRELFVSSANFTEAAQARNIELGVLLRSSELASQVSSFLRLAGRIRTLPEGELKRVSSGHRLLHDFQPKPWDGASCHRTVACRYVLQRGLKSRTFLDISTIENWGTSLRLGRVRPVRVNSVGEPGAVAG